MAQYSKKKPTVFTIKSFYEEEILSELQERFDAFYFVGVKYVGPKNEHKRVIIRKKQIDKLPNPIDFKVQL